jgi:hypothetical protein
VTGWRGAVATWHPVVLARPAWVASSVTDINDRLQRLNRRDELTRRVRERTAPPPVAGVGDDFAEVVDAVAEVVRRRPGLSVLVAPGDGRQGSAVVRITERLGDVEVAVVTTGGGPPPGPRQPAQPPIQQPARPPIQQPIQPTQQQAQQQAQQPAQQPAQPASQPPMRQVPLQVPQPPVGAAAGTDPLMPPRQRVGNEATDPWRSWAR